MPTPPGPLRGRMSRRASALAAGLVLTAGISTASAPVASAAPAAAQSPAATVLFYQLHNYGSYGLCLDKASGSNQSIVNTCVDTDAPDGVPATQVWSFVVTGSPYIRVADENTNCIGVDGNSTAQGAPVVFTSCAETPNREWDPVYVKTVNGYFMYELVNKNSSLCLTDDNDDPVPGHEVNQSTCTKNDAMLWYIALNGGSI